MFFPEYFLKNIYITSLSTFSPVIGQVPPLASVAAITELDSQSISREEVWRKKGQEKCEKEVCFSQFAILWENQLIMHYTLTITLICCDGFFSPTWK